jgi:cytochrome c-type biogenesis protein
MVLDIVSLFYPFTAGVFVLLSPCGYALIPGYISYYLGSEITVSRALKGGVASTLGLITIYSIIGLGATGIGGFIKPYVTLFTVFAAIILIVLGLLIIVEIPIPSAYFQIFSSEQRGMQGFYLFGITYGLAAAGCTAPIFFSIILLSLTISGPFNVLITFLLYALGVGVPLIATSFLVATAKRPLITRIQNLTPRLHKISGIVLILVGLYLIYYYLTSGLITF